MYTSDYLQRIYKEYSKSTFQCKVDERGRFVGPKVGQQQPQPEALHSGTLVVPFSLDSSWQEPM
jgi:hypothetical protein